jgi:flagellar motor switch protein FliN/FliY
METAAPMAVQEFCDAWKNAFRSVLESLGATALVCTWTAPLSNAAVSAPRENAISTRFHVGHGLQGAAIWVCQKSTAVQLAQLLQMESLDSAADLSSIHRLAFAEFLRQIARQVATTWKIQTGNEIDLAIVDFTEPPRFLGAQAAVLEIESEKFSPLSLQLFLDPALCSALAAGPPPKQVAEAPQIPASTDSQFNLGATPNLALLLDVELQATIRFGQRDMLLREVFGLMPGAVVELDQLVNEPVGLFVAGRLIARGEVVVVDGNFGLRITEVAVANQRAALLDL